MLRKACQHQKVSVRAGRRLHGFCDGMGDILSSQILKSAMYRVGLGQSVGDADVQASSLVGVRQVAQYLSILVTFMIS